MSKALYAQAQASQQAGADPNAGATGGDNNDDVVDAEFEAK